MITVHKLCLLSLITWLISSCTSNTVSLESEQVESGFNHITAIDFASDGNTLLATGQKQPTEESQFGAIELWDISKRELIQTIETDRNHNLWASFTSEANDEIVLVDGFGGVSLWSLRDGRKKGDLIERTEERALDTVIEFSPIQQTLSLGYYSGKLTLLNIRTGKLNELYSLEGGYRWSSLAFSDDAKYLAASSYKERNRSMVYIFDIDSKKQIASISIESETILDAAFLSSNHLAIAGFNGVLEIRDFRTGNIVHQPQSENHLSNKAIELASADEFVAIGSNWTSRFLAHALFGKVTIWNSDLEKPLCTTNKMSSVAYMNDNIAISPDNKKLITTNDRSIVIWDLEKCF